MIKFITTNGSLEIKSGDTVLLLTPMSNLAFTSLDLYNDIPRITLYNANVGVNEIVFTANLSEVADNDGNFFTVDSFLTYASLNFGMTMTESITPIVDSLIYKFPIESGQTISTNDFVMLNNSGKIFEVASTGTVPISIPIGSGAEYSQTLAPNQDRDNLVRFIDNNENFILFFYAGFGVGSYFQGGSVDDLGNFTYLNSPTLQNASARFIEFDIDETTFGQPVVKGCCSYVYATGSSNLYGMAFEYTVATQTFVFGAEFDFGSNMGDSDSAGNITNVGAGKYILVSTRFNVTFIATVSNLVITKQANTTIPSQREKSHFVKISNDKVIFCVLSTSYYYDAYIFDISGNVITVGNKSTSTWENFNFSQATRQIDSDNKFYMCVPPTGGGNQFITQQTYDAINDIVVFNNRLQLDTGIYVTDISYDPNTNIVIASGVLSSVPSASIINFASSSIINKTVGVSSGNHNGMGVNSQGDVVFNYSNGGKGTTTYGQLGDITSNLDPEKTIGVASDSLGNVKISGSVITNPSLNLTINSKVYVDVTGVISTTISDGAISIGFAITTTSFILTISR